MVCDLQFVDPSFASPVHASHRKSLGTAPESNGCGLSKSRREYPSGWGSFVTRETTCKLQANGKLRAEGTLDAKPLLINFEDGGFPRS